MEGREVYRGREGVRKGERYIGGEGERGSEEGREAYRGREGGKKGERYIGGERES